MLIDKKQFNNQTIYFYQDIDEKDIKTLNHEHHISYEILGYVSDAKERPRVEFDEETNSWTMIYNVPLDYSRPLFAPIGIVCDKNNIYIFLSQKTLFVRNSFDSILKNGPQDETDDNPSSLTTWMLILDVLYVITTKYFDLISAANSKRVELDQEMQGTTSNESILALAELSKDFVFLLTSLNANVVALQSLKLYEHRLSTELVLSVDEREHLNDVLIEAQQAQSMVQLYSDITDKMTNNYNNLINNNMNNIMKFLTIYSIVLTVPTIVTGFYGMNVKLPLANTEWSWVVTIVITVIASIGIWWIMKKKHLL